MKKSFIKKIVPIVSDIIIALVVALLFIKAPSDEDLKFNYLFIVSIGYICYALIHSVLFCVLIKDFFAVTSVKVIFISIVATIVFIPTPAFAITSFGTILCAISYFISKKQLLQKRLAISTALKISVPILVSNVLLRSASMGSDVWIYTLLINAVSGFTYGCVTYSHTNQISVSCYSALFIPNYSPVVTVISSLFGALMQRHIEKQAKNSASEANKTTPKLVLSLIDVFASLIILCPFVASLLDNNGDLAVFGAFIILGVVYFIYSAWFGFLCTLQKCKLLIFYLLRIALSIIIIFCFVCLHPHTHHNLWSTVVSSCLIISLSFIATVLSALLSSYLKNKASNN